MPPPSAEANIQVVVRCRPRNDREIKDNSPPVLAFNSARAKELQIRLADRTGDRNTTKTYTFDRVFSPDATQQDVYADVVAPMLEEVLAGYNCTVFAYGQTGTGKTYTMEGSLQEVDGQLTDDAGMIPRALFNLFELLDMASGESTVKVSCIELYNEELRDLLAPGDDLPKIRLYEQKQVVNLQGVQEVYVKSPADVHRVLREANEKRQIAATKLNQNSSRSHCVCTVSVVTRDTSPEGIDLVRTGKLNLVDLAGSENIGRSGAQDKRAREAGMINQSLLTLGRVINALVEKSCHIPYRESKLTRLLQDSLGGRTKTCIIATVSPARCNLEESQSTIDYVHRAKNIRNKPEVNQRVMKRVLISSYAEEIARLQADLQASREKNGVYLTPERYEELIAAADGAKAQQEAARVEKEELEERMRADREDLEEQVRASQDQHAATARRLDEIKAAYAALRAQLTERNAQVDALQLRTQEDRHVLCAVSQREATLRDLIVGMATTIESAASDVQGLHESLDSARSAVAINNSATREHHATLVAELAALHQKLAQFEAAQSKLGVSIHDKIDAFTTDCQESCDRTCAKYDEFGARVGSLLDQIETKVDEYTHHGTAHLGDVKAHLATLKMDLAKVTDAHRRQITDWVGDMAEQMRAFAELARTWNDALATELTDVFSHLAGHFGAQQARLRDLTQHVAQFREASVAALQTTMQTAHATLRREKEQTEAMRADLVAQVANLVNRFVEDRMGAWTTSTNASVDALRRVESNVQDFQHGAARRLAELHDATSTQTVQAQVAMETARRSLADHKSRVALHVEREDQRLERIRAATDAHVREMQLTTGQHAALIEQNLAQGASQLRDHVDNAKRNVRNVAQVVQASMGTLRESMTLTRDGFLKDATWWRHDAQSLVANGQQLVDLATQKVTDLEASTTTLVRKRLRDVTDVPMPEKRRYLGPAPESIPLPLSRADILAMANDDDDDLESLPDDDMDVDMEGGADGVANGTSTRASRRKEDPLMLCGGDLVIPTRPPTAPTTSNRTSMVQTPQQDEQQQPPSQIPKPSMFDSGMRRPTSHMSLRSSSPDSALGSTTASRPPSMVSLRSDASAITAIFDSAIVSGMSTPATTSAPTSPTAAMPPPSSLPRPSFSAGSPMPRPASLLGSPKGVASTGGFGLAAQPPSYTSSPMLAAASMPGSMSPLLSRLPKLQLRGQSSIVPPRAGMPQSSNQAD
ncbi:kinesin motor protein cin8 [Allomyces arbusculus]|nr:kinesin motor protein cin8 [Allomyces arbusculus]